MSKASERIKAALATNRIVMREEVKVLLGQYEQLKAQCNDLMALCEGINHALWLDPDASHDTDEAPAEIDAWRKVIEAQRGIIEKLPLSADNERIVPGVRIYVIQSSLRKIHQRTVHRITVIPGQQAWIEWHCDKSTPGGCEQGRVFIKQEAAEAARALAARSDDV